MGVSRRNRSHHKVETLSCRQKVDKMLADGHTYEEIQQAAKDAGESIGIASLSRYHNKYAQVAERLSKTREAMQVIIDSVRDRPDTDLAQVASQMMMQGLMDRVSMAAGDDFQDISLEKTGKLIADLQRADVARERLKMQFTKGVDAAIAVLKDQLKAELGQRPDLLDEMYRVVDQAADKAKAQVS